MNPEAVTQVSTSLSQIPYVLAVIVTALGMFFMHWKALKGIGVTFSKESALRQKQLIAHFNDTRVWIETVVARGEESAKLHVNSALEITRAVAKLEVKDESRSDR